MACVIKILGRILGIALLASGVAACASTGEGIQGTSLIAPGKFDLYSCRDIEDRTKAVSLRHTELEQLMARSAQSTGGEFINAIAYRSDYAQASGELKALAQAASEKQCASRSKYSSGRSIF